MATEQHQIDVDWREQAIQRQRERALEGPSPYRAAHEDEPEFDGTEPTNPSRCQNCNHPVSARFRAAMGDQDDIAHACPQCADKAQLGDGAAAFEDYDLDAEICERRHIGANNEVGYL